MHNKITFFFSIKLIFSLVNVVQNSLLVSLKKLLIIINLFFFLTELQFKFFSDLLVIDYPIFFLRFLSIYNIVSMSYNNRVFFKTIVPLDNSIDSVTKSFTCASWFERESWDLFGVFYLQNLDLRRILNDYGFYGHPLKKDFPLSGFLEVHIYVFLSLVFYGNIKMGQGFRFFSSISPWKRRGLC
jgi:NADH-quinone oxidoreductase subunit C